MINNISFAGKEQPIAKGLENTTKKFVNKVNEYVSPGKFYSQEEIKAAKEMAAKDNVIIAEKVDEYMGPQKLYSQEEIDTAKAVAAETKAKAAEKTKVNYTSPFVLTETKAEEKSAKIGENINVFV